MGVKMTLTFDDETMETLRRKAREEGFVRPSVFTRYLLLQGLKKNMQAEIDDDRQVIRVEVDNYREIKAFVCNKKFGTVDVFANFAMAQYMSKYPRKTAAERGAGETTKD
ncbi:MAG: hypothetical protein LBG57_13595 [Treponema sp.]|jgi:hypothetical protein|nr:hypothetical protein [Treponema sp.]